MATGSYLSIVDVTNRLDPDLSVAPIAEMLSQCNEFIDDVPWQAGNEVGGHEFTLRTSIPTGYWRQLGQGTPFSKSTTVKARVSMGELVGWSQIDQTTAEASGDVAAFRETEDVAFLEGMSQTLIQTFIYGNSTTNPASFMGLAPFYNTVNQNTAMNAAAVIDGGGTGNSNTSIWGVGWGPRQMFAVYPRGSKFGLAMENFDLRWPAFDSIGNPYTAYTAKFRVTCGLVPMDWRYAFRIANIDTTTAGLAGPNALDIFATLAQAVMLFPTAPRELSGITKSDAPNDSASGVRFVIYVNRTIRHWMDVQAIRNRQVLLTPDQYAGRPVDRFRGTRIAVVDQIINSEARVV